MDAIAQGRTIIEANTRTRRFATRKRQDFNLPFSARAGSRSPSRGQFRLAISGRPGSTREFPAIERDVKVTFSHRIYFTHSTFCRSNALLSAVLTEGDRRRSQRVLVVVDAVLAQAQPQLLEQIDGYFARSTGLELVASPILIEGGERVKNSHRPMARIESHINRHNLDRHSYVIAIGGGAMLDMVGLAAALAHRGLRHVRIPSTTLSQDDSGVGVKNGINAFGKKNFIGTFAPPFAVINDFELLKSLSPRDKRAGYAEAVKVALIRDAGFFEAMEQGVEQLRDFDSQAMERVIYRCAELHVNHIANSRDPFEFGSARPLDFGHWSAHKLEQLSNYRIRHGEAVAIGIALDVIYSRLAGLMDRESSERVLALLEGLGFELFAKELLQVNASGRLSILEGLEEFRQHLGGRLTITLLEGIGQEITVHTMKIPLLLKAVRELGSRQKAIRV
jgi:3-dehydroquinate synthase